MAAEALVNVVLEQLVSAAADWMKDEIALIKGVKSELENMKGKMLIIYKVLEDAENQSVKKDIVKSWLVNLKDVSYDMDDVLDEWSTRVLILKREEVEKNNTEIADSSSTSPATCFSLKNLNCFSSVKQLTWQREIAKRIKHINERTDSVFLEMKDFELASKAVGNDGLDKIITQDHIARPTTSNIEESKVYGRDKDKKFLLSKILSMNTEEEKSLQVISIVGTGGLGKTTLAQIVYNDEDVKKKFGEKRIWVCVSNPFDEFKVARYILEGLKVDHTKMISLEALHQAIGESLSGHKFFLVLDDVWDEDFQKWEKLSICLKLGDPNSRILVTTRKEGVARLMGTPPSNILKPQHISDLHCWFLMRQIAFQGRTNANSELEDIGKEIAKKCKGLPLAANTLGGMLISKCYVDEWKEILNSEIWELEQAEVDLFPHIFLSYQELPAVLKRCFLILAIFPKDTKLEVEEVIAIWMAHGFLKARTKEDDMVKTGKKYLAFLVSRALLEEEKHNRISLHDIMHDFALHLSGEELISITVLDKIKNNSSSESTSKGCSYPKSTTACHLRHLNIAGNIDPASIVFDHGKFRTCIIRNVAANVASDFVNGLKMVRALYLVNCELEQVPPSITYLIHLRLLDLRHNRIVELPETIGALYNLQQLYLEGYYLSTLPDSIGKLTNLILLKPNDLMSKKAPESVGNLINLQSLGRVEVRAGENKLRLLKDLNQLRGDLYIDFRSDYDDEADAKKAEIERKNHITELTLYFRNHKVTDGVIAALQPPSTIKKLLIRDLPRSCDLLPSWITFLHHLTELTVWGGENVLTLPPFWKFQSLKKLELFKFNALKIIGREFIGFDSKPDKNCSYFPKLVELIFRCCEELTGWEDINPEEEDSISVMPDLQILEFIGCFKLDKLPHRLLGQASSLKTMTIKQKPSIFKFDVGESPRRLNLQRTRKIYSRGDTVLDMIIEDSTKVPKSIIYHSYITLLDLYFAEQPIFYMPPMGRLPYLQSLSIEDFNSVELMGRDILGIDDPNNNEDFVAFPNLLNLTIINCNLLKEWEDLKAADKDKVSVMPKLQSLVISCCPKLQALPSRLLCQAASLEEIRCYFINDSFAENIRKDEQLLRRVKSVIVDYQQCSLHPSTMSDNVRGSCTINLPSFVIVLLFIVIFELELCLI